MAGKHKRRELPTIVARAAPQPQSDRIEKILLTPEKAVDLLEHNTTNRPMNDAHMQRIASQIAAGKWKYNGDTIKVSEDGGVLDGQHRLWAVIEAKRAVETVIVYGIKRDAFATIDTLRKTRTGADVIALNGTTRHRNIVATALTWLLRWQRDALVSYKAAENRIENSDIEAAFREHPEITKAVERVMVVRGIGNVSIIAFLYYVLANRDLDLAERMVDTLHEPGRISVDDPFFRLRAYFTADHHKRKEPIVTLALAIKAANAAAKNQRIKALSWKNQGKAAEGFPILEVGGAGTGV